MKWQAGICGHARRVWPCDGLLLGLSGLSCGLELSKGDGKCRLVLIWMVSATYRGINHEAGSLHSDSGTKHADDGLDGLITILTGHLLSLALFEGIVVVHGDYSEGLKL